MDLVKHGSKATSGLDLRDNLREWIEGTTQRRNCSATATCQDLPEGALLWRLATLCDSVVRHANFARACAYWTNSRGGRTRHHGRGSTVLLLVVNVFVYVTAGVFKATCGIRMLRARGVAIAMHRRYGDINMCCGRKRCTLSWSIGAHWGKHLLCLVMLSGVYYHSMK